MSRKCTCKICGNKGTTDTFYLVEDNGKRKYYCNQEEYKHFINERNKREELIKYIAEDIFEYEEGQIVSPVLLKKIKQLNGFYDYDVILDCFRLNKDNIQYWMSAKNFSSEYNMICYIMKIIEGNINDVYVKWKFKRKQAQEQENNNVDLSIMDDLNVTHIAQQKDNGILSFLDEEDI